MPGEQAVRYVFLQSLIAVNFLKNSLFFGYSRSNICLLKKI